VDPARGYDEHVRWGRGALLQGVGEKRPLECIFSVDVQIHSRKDRRQIGRGVALRKGTAPLSWRADPGP